MLQFASISCFNLLVHLCWERPGFGVLPLCQTQRLRPIADLATCKIIARAPHAIMKTSSKAGQTWLRLKDAWNSHINILQSRKEIFFLIKETWVPFYFGRFCGTRDNLHGKCTKWLCHGWDLKNQARCSEVSFALNCFRTSTCFHCLTRCNARPELLCHHASSSFCSAFARVRSTSRSTRLPWQQVLVLLCLLSTDLGRRVPQVQHMSRLIHKSVSLCVPACCTCPHIQKEDTVQLHIAAKKPWSFAWFLYGVCCS